MPDHPPVPDAHLNEVTRRALARAIQLERELARLIEPILVRAGEKAARNFARRATNPYKGLDLQTPTWQPPPAALLLDIDALTREIRKKTEPVMEAFGEKIIEEMLGTPPLNAAGVEIDWTTTNPLVGQAKAATGAQITNIAQTTRGDVMKAINGAYNEGLSIPNTADRIREKMTEASSGRARLIARTEMTRTVNASSLASVSMVDNATGQGHYKIWLTAPGAKHARHETYAGLNGQTKPLNAYFDVGGANMMYPGDPIGPASEVCNCRCGLSYTEEAPTGGEPDYSIPTISGEGVTAVTPTESVAQRLGLGPGMDFRDIFGTYDAEGRWIPNAERQVLHDQIIQDILKHAQSKENPEAIFTAGGSGVGKSSILKRLGLSDEELAQKHIVKIDPDEIKAMLPEYQELIDSGDPLAAQYAHEESSYLAKQIMDLAYTRNYDVIIDGTGDGNVGSYLEKIIRAKNNGFRTRVIFVDAKWKDAVEFAEDRARRSGRKVDEAVMRDIHTKVSQRYPEWADSQSVDEWEMHVNTIERDRSGKPVKDTEGHYVVHSEKVADRKAGVTTIHDEDKFRASLAKGEELREPPVDIPISVLDITAPDPAEWATGSIKAAQAKAEKFLLGREKREGERMVDISHDEREKVKAEVALKLTRRLQDNKDFQAMYGITEVKKASELEVGDIARPLHGNPGDVIRITHIDRGIFHMGLKDQDVIHYRVERSATDAFGGVGYEGTFTKKLETEWIMGSDDTLDLNLPPLGQGGSIVNRGVSGLISNWAATSADADMWALAIQKAIQDEFGLGPQAFGNFIGRVPGDALKDAEKIYAQHQAGLRAFVRAMYEQTQQELREQGISEIVMYRGLKVRGKDYLEPGEIRANGYSLERAEMQPASSFSSDYTTAMYFGPHPDQNVAGAITAARIPAARILASARTGFGCLSEGEFIVLADKPGYRSQMWIFNSNLGEGRLLTPNEVSRFWDSVLRHRRGIPFQAEDYKHPPKGLGQFPPQPKATDPNDLPF